MSSVYHHRFGRGMAALLLGAAGVSAQAQGAPARPPVTVAITGGVIPSPPTTPQQKSLLLQMQDAFTNITQTVEPTVVNIKSERDSGGAGDDGGDGQGGAAPRGGLPFSGPGTPSVPHGSRRSYATGSGVIVRGDGYILTNDHVVEGAIGGVVTVTLFDGREFKGKVFPDYKSDLAIVKIDPGTAPLPVAVFADAGTVRTGQWALAVGSPFDLQNTVTVGIISAVGRHQRISGEGQARYYPDLIQTDAAINPGNSGGPLFNIDGKIVGINVAIESPVEGSAGVGFAIPVTIAQSVAGALIGQGQVRRGYLGLAPVDLTPAVVEQYGQKQGAFVQDVVLDSPAGKAGLQAADIVTAFNGKPVTDEVTLRQAIAATTPGQKVVIAYVRDGAPATATATITAPPGLVASLPSVTPPATPARRRLGLSVRDLTARDRLALNLPADATGVAVASVAPGGPAESAALGADIDLSRAVIQKINRTPVHNKQEFSQAVAALGDSTVTLIVVYVSDSITHQQALPLRL